MKSKPANTLDRVSGNTKTWVGFGLVLMASLGFSTNILFANLAYRDGIDIHTIISVFMMGIGYLGATQYIPVSLAVLIFYTHPFLVAIIARFTENEPITPIRLLAITIAFIGLAFAMGIQSVAGLNWYGIAFGFLGALGAASYVTISSLAIRSADTQTVNFHCLTACPCRLVQAGCFKLGPDDCLCHISYRY
jgi:drug/metabolite transporter (DMT)-like permease